MEREIEVLGGSTLESVVYTLLAAKSRGEHVYCIFNGHKLHSDSVSMDSAYMEVCGYTKAEHDHKMNEWQENYKKQEEIAKQRAKENIPSWIKKGQELIFPERYEEWEKCVQARANDLYHGLELDSALEIMQALENGASMEEASKILYNQGHSGMSASLVRNILFSFSSRGPEFWEATAYGEISPENKKILEDKKQENMKLAQINVSKTDDTKKHM